MLVFVVPRFTQTFEELGAELPLATRMLITISDAMIFILPITIGLILFGVRWYRKHKEERGVRVFMDNVKTKTPVLGTFFRKVAIARFARTFAALMASGVPVLQALEIVSRTSTSMSVSIALDKVREDVRAGKPINTTMMEFDIFPPLVTQMIATGEETGALPSMLDKVAEYYEREVDDGSESLGALIEPILLIFLSVIVGGMVLALYLPTFAIFETVSAG
jgi:type IV pilus assembly protein PilC